MDVAFFHLIDDGYYVVAHGLRVWVCITVSDELFLAPPLPFFELLAGLTRRDECDDRRYHDKKNDNQAGPPPWRDTRRGRRWSA